MNRTGEQGTTASRCQRFFKKDDYWYYSTREGVNIGPFDTLNEAEIGASEFIDFIMHAEPNIIKTLEKYGRAA
ncbi:MAG: hypothetical protein ACI9Y1_001310 [Lentisphaeria bacterium]|jgi:hypothetical protein